MTNFKIFRWIKENVPDWAQAVVASPDEGGTRRAGQFFSVLRWLIGKQKYDIQQALKFGIQQRGSGQFFSVLRWLTGTDV